MEQFEYKVFEIHYENDRHTAEVYLNSFGKQGWELIHIIKNPGTLASKYHYYFKRKINSDN